MSHEFYICQKEIDEAAIPPTAWRTGQIEIAREPFANDGRSTNQLAIPILRRIRGNDSDVPDYSR
jgi:hypothetical protein